jgi:HK97 family phage major capsid protein
LEEDSIIAMAPFIRDEIIEGLAYGLEDAYLNGDDSGTHMDNDTNGGAADLAAKTWIGLRKHAQANSVTQDLSTFSTANLRALRKKLGKYGADPRNLAWIVSIKGLIAMMGLAEVITLDKFGPLATVITGQLAMFDGIPVIVSEEMRDDVAATGVNTLAGPNTLSNLILANRRSWIRGIRRAPTVKTKEDIETDQLIVVVTWRGDFQRTLGTAETHTGQGINFS